MCSTCGCKSAESFEAPMTRYDEYCISCGSDSGANSNLCIKCQKMFGVKKASNRMIARLGLGAESFEAERLEDLTKDQLIDLIRGLEDREVYVKDFIDKIDKSAESFEAEKDNHYYEFNFEMLDSNDKPIDFYVWSSPNGLSYTKATKLAKNHAKKVAEKGVEPYSPKPNKRVSKIKFTSVTKISGDYKKQEEYSPNRYPLEINLGAESFDEDDDDWRDWGEGMTIPQMAKALSKMSWDEVDEETGYGDDLFDWFNKWDKKSQKERETYALRVLKESYEAESFEAQRKLTDIDRDGKPYTGQIYPDHPDLDPVKADRNKDGYMSSWERALGNQVARGMEKYKSERKPSMKRMSMRKTSRKSTSILPSVIVVGVIAAVVGSKIRK